MKYIFLATIDFCSSYITEEKRNGLEKLLFVSMLSCGALERSNNPYIKLIVEPCVSKNQKGIFAMWVCFERKF